MSAPLVRIREEVVPAVSTAGNDDDTVLGQAPFAGSVAKVEYVPEAAITGAATNNRTLSLINKGQAGSGTTVVASLNFGNGTNATASNEVTLTLSATASDLVVAEGDTLVWRSLHIGTGITDPGGLARVTFSRATSS
ncbi:MAG TPA: hypothetical protein VIQ30_24225 [Pseudonocardia sp.]